MDLLCFLLGTVKASFPTTLSKDIEELRQKSHRNPQTFDQGLNEKGISLYVLSYMTYKL